MSSIAASTVVIRRGHGEDNGLPSVAALASVDLHFLPRALGNCPDICSSSFHFQALGVAWEHQANLFCSSFAGDRLSKNPSFTSCLPTPPTSSTSNKTPCSLLLYQNSRNPRIGRQTKRTRDLQQGYQSKGQSFCFLRLGYYSAWRILKRFNIDDTLRRFLRQVGLRIRHANHSHTISIYS